MQWINGSNSFWIEQLQNLFYATQDIIINSSVDDWHNLHSANLSPCWWSCIIFVGHATPPNKVIKLLRCIYPDAEPPPRRAENHDRLPPGRWGSVGVLRRTARPRRLRWPPRYDRWRRRQQQRERHNPCLQDRDGKKNIKEMSKYVNTQPWLRINIEKVLI